jgi:hypothetical protein
VHWVELRPRKEREHVSGRLSVTAAFRAGPVTSRRITAGGGVAALRRSICAQLDMAFEVHTMAARAGQLQMHHRCVHTTVMHAATACTGIASSSEQY